jgi:hypothetical protein
MLTQGPIRIPAIPGKIRQMKKDDREYVLYLAGRKYNREKKHSEPDWVLIGRRIEKMPGLMYPNDNYEKYFGEETEEMAETTTPEEQRYARDHGTYGLYIPFFDGIYHEFKQQTRKKADDPVNRYKAENINKVLKPLKEMMREEEYAGFLGLIETGDGEKEEGMSYGDVMILLTQYKTALGKYHRTHL